MKKLLFKKYFYSSFPSVKAYFSFKLGDDVIAEDLAQQTFLKAWKSFDSFKGLSQNKTWLYAISKNILVDYYRKNRLESEFVDIELCFEDKKNLRMDIHVALDDIEPRHREIFLQHFLYGYTYQQISNQYDLPIGTVKSLINRSKKIFLKSYLKE